MPLEGDPQTLLEVLEMLAALWQQRENGCFDFFNMYPEGKSWRPRRLEQPVLDGCWFEGASLPLRRGQMVVVLADFSFFSLCLKLSWMGPVQLAPLPHWSHNTGGEVYPIYLSAGGHPTSWWRPFNSAVSSSDAPLPRLIWLAHYHDLIASSVLWLVVELWCLFQVFFWRWIGWAELLLLHWIYFVLHTCLSKADCLMPNRRPLQCFMEYIHIYMLETN